ncbi:MAG TPA: acyl-ACP--UDP-N-acetylglucosamine O-acyltransferase [Rhizomicrobium sp.]|jgi:UDP-N-acetylglucosamine acyltransferase
MTIHPTAIIESDARIAQGVIIGPYCVVGPHAELAEGVVLHSHVVIKGHTEIGSGTVVHSHCVLGGPAQMRRNNPPGMRLVIGSENILREGVTISTGSSAGHGITTIGNRCYLMAASHVGHDCIVGDDVTLSNGAQLGGHVEIGDGAILGGLAAVQQFGRVGRYAFISGLSGVTTDVIPYGMAIGLHVRLGGLNLIGLRRRGIPRERIHALRAAYRIIFLEGDGRIQDRAAHVGARWPEMPEVQEVVAFILAEAKRPICPARSREGASDSEE